VSKANRINGIAMASPDISEEDVAAVLEVLRSGRLALGPKTEEFEQGIAEYVGVRHAIAVSSGTAALHLIVRALGIGQGDEVLVPSFTFAASVNSILYEGARPVFVDIEPDTYNIDPGDALRKVSSKTKAIMAVDVFGHPAEWDDILSIAERYGLLVVDDSCEALGAEYKGRRVGRFGDAAAFAFYPNKQITTGEGGMIVTDNDDLARKAMSLRNQGRGSMGGWLEHEMLGFNYRMDEMSAALGTSQLNRVEMLLAQRETVAGMYSMALSDVIGVRTPTVRQHVRMSWFVYVVTLDEGIDRDKVMAFLKENGVPSRAYFSPIHTQPYIKKTVAEVESLPVTEMVASRTIALPFSPLMTVEEVKRVVDVLKEGVERIIKEK